MTEGTEYVVERNTGRGSDDWRPVLRPFVTEVEARNTFERAATAIRQGGVRVVRITEGRTPEVVAMAKVPWAPHRI